jgi:hypothetical protein
VPRVGWLGSASNELSADAAGQSGEANGSTTGGSVTTDVVVVGVVLEVVVVDRTVVDVVDPSSLDEQPTARGKIAAAITSGANSGRQRACIRILLRTRTSGLYTWTQCGSRGVFGRWCRCPVPLRQRT